MKSAPFAGHQPYGLVSSALMHIYLLRHGQSHVNLADLTAAHRDEPLTDVGVAQAQAFADHAAEHLRVDRLISSTVQRAAQTAQVVGDRLGMTPRWEERIREVGTVAPDGRPIAEGELEPYLPERWGTLQPYEPVTESGESWMQVRARVGSFIESLVPGPARVAGRVTRSQTTSPEPAGPEESVLVVCHAGVIEAVFEYVFEKGPWSVVAVETNNTGLTHLQFFPTPHRPDWRLHFHNRIVHLPEDLIT